MEKAPEEGRKDQRRGRMEAWAVVALGRQAGGGAVRGRERECSTEGKDTK